MAPLKKRINVVAKCRCTFHAGLLFRCIRAAFTAGRKVVEQHLWKRFEKLGIFSPQFITIDAVRLSYESSNFFLATAHSCSAL